MPFYKVFLELQIHFTKILLLGVLLYVFMLDC